MNIQNKNKNKNNQSQFSLWNGEETKSDDEIQRETSNKRERDY